MAVTQVKEVMTPNPGTCSVNASANDAARIMWERDCGSVPIVDHAGSVVGMVTDRDICMAAYFQGRSLSEIRLSDIMSREVCTCDQQEDVFDAERRMRTNRVRRLPVVDGDGTLAGIVSLSDVAQEVVRTGGLAQVKGQSREFLETVAVVSEPRHDARIPASV